MAQVKLIEYNPEIHFDFMSHNIEGGTAIEKPPGLNGNYYVFVLDVSGKQLVFKDISQLKEAKNFFEKKIRPSTIGNPPPYEHHWHVWFGRLPKKVLKASNRDKILKAINNALEKYAETV